MALMRPFMRELRAGMRKVAAQCVASRSPHASQAYEEYEWDIVEGLSVSELSRILARILLQAEADKAECVTFKLDEGKLFYTIGGQEYEMLPPPIPILVDLARVVMKNGRTRQDGASLLDVPMEGGTRTLVAEVPDSAPCHVVIRGFA